MPRRLRQYEKPLVPCSLCDETRQQIKAYTDALIKNAPNIGDHGLSQKEFWNSGLFRATIESIRGTQAASGREKREFIEWALEKLQDSGKITSYSFTGAGDRHDYEIVFPDNRQSVIEAKGCLDGNNTNIFQRPPNADEFFIWSLCQNPGADPRHNVWSGLHTRIGAEIIARNTRVDAVIVWDRLCGLFRTCPKLNEGRGIEEKGRAIPPPCVYLFPRTIPDPRNNPDPPVCTLEDTHLAKALLAEFGGDMSDVTEVHIKARLNGYNLERQTTLIRSKEIIHESDWTELRRAAR